MRLSILYQQRSDHARSVTDFVELLRRRYPDKTPVLEDIETREGAATASLYGIMRYPAIIVMAFDGSVLGMWEGLPLPLIDEVVGAMLESQGVTV